MGHLSRKDEVVVKTALEKAVIACTERCLYHSAKWSVHMWRRDRMTDWELIYAGLRNFSIPFLNPRTMLQTPTSIRPCPMHRTARYRQHKIAPSYD